MSGCVKGYPGSGSAPARRNIASAAGSSASPCEVEKCAKRRRRHDGKLGIFVRRGIAMESEERARIQPERHLEENVERSAIRILDETADARGRRHEARRHAKLLAELVHELRGGIGPVEPARRSRLPQPRIRGHMRGAAPQHHAIGAAYDAGNAHRPQREPGCRKTGLQAQRHEVAVGHGPHDHPVGGDVHHRIDRAVMEMAAAPFLLRVPDGGDARLERGRERRRRQRDQSEIARQLAQTLHGTLPPCAKRDNHCPKPLRCTMNRRKVTSLALCDRSRGSRQVHPMAMADISFELCRPLAADARLVMTWRNDPTTLAMSFHRAPWREETFWPEFRDRYFRTRPPPLFAHAGGERVAFLRFRPVPHPMGLAGTCVDISINVAPARRGRGLGSAIVAAVSEHLIGEGVDTIYAEIRAGNAPSQRMFEAAGYDCLGPAETLVEDTGESVPILRYAKELVPPFWRRGRVFVIAEAGSNWRIGTARRDLAMASALIDVAADAGADAVKFQTYRAETLYVANAGSSDYLAAAGITDDIGDLLGDLAMPYEMLGELAERCRRRELAFMSTGFSAADFAAIDPHVAVHKIASYELGHLRLIDLAAASGKPLVMSTGASEDSDIAWAVERFRTQGGRELCLMQCTAKYPAPLASLNLAVIPALRRRFGACVGLSDHSRDPVTAPLAAVALGARAIEKHFTLHNALPGPDHAFAVTPDELKQMVRRIREAEEARGAAEKQIVAAERELAAYARRGVQALRDIAAGEVLREGHNIDILRPGKRKLGVHPRNIEEMAGCRATRNIAAGDGMEPGDWA